MGASELVSSRVRAVAAVLAGAVVIAAVGGPATAACGGPAYVSVAVGPVGAGVGAATENLSADLIVFSRSKCLSGGVSLQGAALAIRHEWNQACYGRPVTPTDILVRGDAGPQRAARLLATLGKVAERT